MASYKKAIGQLLMGSLVFLTIFVGIIHYLSHTGDIQPDKKEDIRNHLLYFTEGKDYRDDLTYPLIFENDSLVLFQDYSSVKQVDSVPVAIVYPPGFSDSVYYKKIEQIVEVDMYRAYFLYRIDLFRYNTNNFAMDSFKQKGIDIHSQQGICITFNTDIKSKTKLVNTLLNEYYYGKYSKRSVGRNPFY